MNHPDCLLIDREVCRRERWESEMMLSFLAVSTGWIVESGAVYREKIQEGHFSGRGEIKCMSLS